MAVTTGTATLRQHTFASRHPPKQVKQRRFFSKDYVKFEDKYYVISEGHKSFLADKIADDDYYILTLAAIAKELEWC